ncbi:MAG: hypothetical protein LBV27_08495 [Oscillospiraceae bacterium]|jgi:hypothetical protein|nr:hypothetical protein [Oscillospiraceae bacterium]
MASILEEFAYGNVSPNEQTFKRDSEYGRAMELVVRNEQKLLDRLEGDDKDLFRKFVDAQGEADRLAAVKNFIYGYKLGLIMTAEAFTGMDALYAGCENI